MYCFECKEFWEKKIESLNFQVRVGIIGINNFKIDIFKIYEQLKYYEKVYRVVIFKQRDFFLLYVVIVSRKLNEVNLMKVLVRFRNVYVVVKLDIMYGCVNLIKLKGQIQVQYMIMIKQGEYLLSIQYRQKLLKQCFCWKMLNFIY